MYFLQTDKGSLLWKYECNQRYSRANQLDKEKRKEVIKTKSSFENEMCLRVKCPQRKVLKKTGVKILTLLKPIETINPIIVINLSGVKILTLLKL